MRTMTISGHLGHDPEIRRSSNGTDIANFDVAVRQNRPDQNGDYNSDWVRCAVFGKKVSIIEQYFHKGDYVVLSGEWARNEYTTRDGERRTSIELIVSGNFDLPQRASDAQSTSKPNDPFANNGDSIDVSDDDLPF